MSIGHIKLYNNVYNRKMSRYENRPMFLINMIKNNQICKNIDHLTWKYYSLYKLLSKDIF